MKHIIKEKSTWLRNFSGSSVVNNMLANAGDPGDSGLIPGLGRSPGEGNDDSLKYSFLGNPMNRRAGWATVHGMQRVRQDRARTHTHG